MSPDPLVPVESVITRMAALKEKMEADEKTSQIKEAWAVIASTKLTAIKDEEGEKKYSEMLLQAKTFIKELNAREKYFLEIPKIEQKAIKAFFSTLKESLEKFVPEVANRISQYAAKKHEEARKAQEKLDKEIQRQQARVKQAGIEMPAPKIQAPPPPTKVKTSEGTVYQVIEYKVVIEDFMALVRAAAAGEVPPGVFYIVDQAAVMKWVLKLVADETLSQFVLDADSKALEKMAKQGRLEIPGVKITQETKTRTRS